MTLKYYLDTSIWMDYYEEREDPSKNIGYIAFKLLSFLLASKSKILVSNFLLRELETAYSIDIIRGIFFPFQNLVIKVEISESQREEAKRIAGERSLPKGDAIHAILARDNNAILVSRDKHFQLLKDICEVAKPEEII